MCTGFSRSERYLYDGHTSGIEESAREEYNVVVVQRKRRIQDLSPRQAS